MKPSELLAVAQECNGDHNDDQAEPEEAIEEVLNALSMEDFDGTFESLSENLHRENKDPRKEWEAGVELLRRYAERCSPRALMRTMVFFHDESQNSFLLVPTLQLLLASLAVKQMGKKASEKQRLECLGVWDRYTRTLAVIDDELTNTNNLFLQHVWPVVWDDSCSRNEEVTLLQVALVAALTQLISFQAKTSLLLSGKLTSVLSIERVLDFPYWRHEFDNVEDDESDDGEDQQFIYQVAACHGTDRCVANTLWSAMGVALFATQDKEYLLKCPNLLRTYIPHIATLFGTKDDSTNDEEQQMERVLAGVDLLERVLKRVKDDNIPPIVLSGTDLIADDEPLNPLPILHWLLMQVFQNPQPEVRLHYKTMAHDSLQLYSDKVVILCHSLIPTCPREMEPMLLDWLRPSLRPEIVDTNVLEKVTELVGRYIQRLHDEQNCLDIQYIETHVAAVSLLRLLILSTDADTPNTDTTKPALVGLVNSLSTVNLTTQKENDKQEQTPFPIHLLQHTLAETLETARDKGFL